MHRHKSLDECLQPWYSDETEERLIGVSNLFAFQGDWVEKQISKQMKGQAPEHETIWIADRLRERLDSMLTRETVKKTPKGIFFSSLKFAITDYRRWSKKQARIVNDAQHEINGKFQEIESVLIRKQENEKCLDAFLAGINASSGPKQAMLQAIYYGLQYKPHEIKTLIGGTVENVKSTIAKARPKLKTDVIYSLENSTPVRPNLWDEKLPHAPPNSIRFFNCINSSPVFGPHSLLQLKHDFSLGDLPVPEMLMSMTRVSIENKEFFGFLDFVFWENFPKALWEGSPLYYGTYKFLLSEDGSEIKELCKCAEMEVSLTQRLLGQSLPPVWEWRGSINGVEVTLRKNCRSRLTEYAGRLVRSKARTFNYGLLIIDQD